MTISSKVSESSEISKSTPTASFENVQLFDTVSLDQTSNDPDNWFAISADIHVTKGFTGDIFLSVPKEFDSFPEGTFDVLQDNKAIGSVSHNSSNIFKVSFKNVESDYNASFNFLSKLNDKPSQPKAVSYEFAVSSGPAFVSTLDFKQRSASISTMDSGVDESGRVYFALTIPYSEYPGSLEFTSNAEPDYKFTGQEFQIVTGVDAFNNPISYVNVTAVENLSDESAISLDFHSTVSGGQSIRVVYYVSADTDISFIKNIAELRYPTLTFYKRDISVIFETTAYLKAIANIDLSGENSVTVKTNSVGSNSTVTSSISSRTALSTITPSHSSYVNESVTYTVVTRTSSGQVTEITSWIPIATLAPSSSAVKVSSSVSYIISSSEVQKSKTDSPSFATVITTTVKGEPSVYTSHVLKCTSCIAGSSSSEVLSTKTKYLSSSSGVNVKSTVETKTVNGEKTEITSLVPVSTIVSDSKSFHQSTKTLLKSSTQDSEVSTILKFLGSSASSSVQSYVIVGQYSGLANRANYGFSTLFIALLALII